MPPIDLLPIRSLPIEEVARQLGLTVVRHKAQCPFHDDRHPSLYFNTARNTYTCFSCQAHGDVIDLAMHMLGKDFKETCLWLAGDNAICMPEPREAHKPATTACFDAARYSRYFQHPYLNPHARDFLFSERRLHPAVVQWCRLNSYTDPLGTSWLQIPYFDAHNRLTGIQNRRLVWNPAKGTPPRFLFPKGSHCSIYNLPILACLKDGDQLWITEGSSDCWAMLSTGRKAIAIPSATLLKASDMEMLRTRLPNIGLHMCPDNDAPGERLFCQLQKHFPHIVRHLLPQDYKDFAEYYRQSLPAHR